jgi:hypothetical protein
MKQYLIIMFINVSLLLISCSGEQKVTIGHDHDQIDTSLSNKNYLNKDAAGASKLTIYPIQNQNMVEVKAWYSNHEILYLSIDGAGTDVIKHNIFTGESEEFYETNYSVTQIIPSKNNEYYAIESKNVNNQSSVQIVNKNGEILYENSQVADLVEFAWSPFEEEKILITYYEPTFTTSIEMLDLHTSNVQTILNIEPYVNWFSNDTVAFFNWDSAPSLSAPINLYNIDTHEQVKWTSSALLFDSIDEHFMYVEEDKNALTFHFVQLTTNTEQSSLSIPRLDSHAGYIWTPFFDWVPSTNQFYTFEPSHTGSVINYNEGFQLIAFNVRTGDKQVVFNSIALTRIDCSNDGKMCLIGNQLEKVVNTTTGIVSSIVQIKKES